MIVERNVYIDAPHECRLRETITFLLLRMLTYNKYARKSLMAEKMRGNKNLPCSLLILCILEHLVRNKVISKNTAFQVPLSQYKREEKMIRG